MSSSTFRFQIKVTKRVRYRDEHMDRDEFFEQLWDDFAPQGLVGVHEGTLLSEEAFEEGLETESWTIDSGEAPKERDWVGGLKEAVAELYFNSLADARRVVKILEAESSVVIVSKPEEQLHQDWDAEWKASFKGVSVPPFWNIVPPWEELKPDGLNLVLNPGAGFGTGTHETTQLCLKLLGRGALQMSPGELARPLASISVLDFGSGSGILSVAAALLGAQVIGVEIDSLANDNARENASLNRVDGQIQFQTELPPSNQAYQVVIANILRPVLIQFAAELINRLGPKGTLILSGLIASDVPKILEVYQPLLAQKGWHNSPIIEILGEWRAIAWQKV